ncbi:MAG: hypothetical protein M3Y13_13095, partial [Armatimonadota bacterium]|nr:hypothetical protein [Armatimonadota bacterium]
MKKYEWWLRLVIVVMIAGAVFVVAGTRHGHPRFPTRYGLDIKGGARAVLEAHPERVPNVPYDQGTIVQTIENRINASGVGEATVQPKGKTQFIVELPDVKNKNEVLQKLGTTAQMTFYYFRDVQSQEFSNRPLRDERGQVGGHEQHTFVVTQPWHGFNPGEGFRDGAQIKFDWAALL